MVDRDRLEEQQRKRRRQTAELAQSRAPAGLAALLRLTPEGRARSRAEWRAQPLRDRALMFVLGAFYAALMALGVWGIASGSTVLFLVAASVLVGGLLASALATAWVEVRRSRRAVRERSATRSSQELP